MPGGDRIGPAGEGPMTGRGLGSSRGGSSGCCGRGGRPLGGQGRDPSSERGRGHGNGLGFYATGLTWWQRVASGLRGLMPSLARREDVAAHRGEADHYEEAHTRTKRRLERLKGHSEGRT